MSTTEHRSLTFARDLRWIVDEWEGLRAQLSGGQGIDTSGVHTATGSRPPASAAVIDVIDEVEQWAAFLTHVLIDETDWTPPAPIGPCNRCAGRGYARDSAGARRWCLGCDGTGMAPRAPRTPDLLRSIADERTGHFTEHPDEALSQAVIDDAARLAKLVRHTANPTGRRTIRLGVQCDHHDTSDLGERIRCAGQYATDLDPSETIGDLVCTLDPAHRMTPLEWQRSQRRDVGRERDLDTLLHTARLRHTA